MGSKKKNPKPITLKMEDTQEVGENLK